MRFTESNSETAVPIRAPDVLKGDARIARDLNNRGNGGGQSDDKIG
jgi:hypothetical protein